MTTTEVTDIDRAHAARDRAKQRATTGLQHYFGMAVPRFDGDCATEVSAIAEDIIEAGAEEAAATILKKIGVRNFADLIEVARLAAALGVIVGAPAPPAAPPALMPRKLAPRFQFARGWIAALHGRDMLGDMSLVEIAVVAAFFKFDPGAALVERHVDVSIPRDLRPNEETHSLAEVLAGLGGRGHDHPAPDCSLQPAWRLAERS